MPTIRPMDGPAFHDTTSLQSRRPEAPQPSRVRSVWAFRAIWFLVFAVVALNATVLAFLATIYATNRTRNSILWVFRLFFLYADENDFSLSHRPLIAATYAFPAAVYAFYAVRLVWMSLRSGSIRFGTAKLSARLSQRLSIRALYNAATTANSRYAQPLVRRLRQWQHNFGVRGPLFEVRLLLDEGIEMLTQTYSAYTASLSHSNPPLNLCYGVVIFINCISTLLVRYFYRHSLIKQRIAWLVSDFVLDFVWGTAIPVWMSMSMYATYTKLRSANGDFDATINSTREVERVVVLSWTNFLVSIVPFCNSFLSLAELVSVLKERPSYHTGEATKPLSHDTSHGVSVRRGRVMRVIHMLTACYGTALLMVSLAAHGAFQTVQHVNSYNCLHRVHPWFSTKEACLGRQINCTATGILGSHAELNTALALFDEVSLSDLIISDCSAMVFPSTLTQFARLRTIAIQGSTVLAWDSTLAPTKALFPGLKTVYLADLDIPNGLVGLVTRPLSLSFEWIGLFRISNVLSLLEPIEGTDLWQHVLYFDCEGSGLTEFPRAIYAMPKLMVLFLIDNDIHTIPDDWPVPQQLQTLLLIANTGLVSLPDPLWHSAAKSCELLLLAHTSLTTIPSWLLEIARPEFRVEVQQTPVCENKAELPLAVQELVVCEPLAR